MYVKNYIQTKYIMIVRSSKHYFTEINDGKLDKLSRMYDLAKNISQIYIDMMLKKELPIMNQLSSKKLPSVNGMDGGRWKQLIYANASANVRSVTKKIRDQTFIRYKRVYAYFKEKGRQTNFISKRYSELNIDYDKRIKINLSKFSIHIDERMCDLQKGNTFDWFLAIKLPFIKEGTKRNMVQINIPIKEHKHSLLFKDWNRVKTVRLSKDDKDRFYISFTYEMKDINKYGEKIIGFDCGYKKLLVSSEHKLYGEELEEIYKKLANKQRGSKNYKQLLIHKNNEVNRIINEIDLTNYKTVYVEDLKNVKYKSKLSSKFNNKLQYWVYSRVLGKLEMKSEIEGFNLVKVNPAYTSQTCSNCGIIDKTSRHGEDYICNSCGFEIDSDINGAINILHRGVYSPPDKKT